MKQISKVLFLGACALTLSASSTGATGATGSKDPSQVARGGGGGGHGGGGYHGGGEYHGGGDFRGAEGHGYNRDARQFENRNQWDRDHGVYINGGADNLYPVAAPLYDDAGDPVDSSYYDDSNQIFNENNNNQY